MTTTVTMHIGDVRDVLAGMIERGETHDLLVSSPPFLALRSYLPADHPDKHREIGSEPTPAAFLDTLYGLTVDWGRVLPEWASVCVELGDTMSGSGGGGGDYLPGGMREGQPGFGGSMERQREGNAAHWRAKVAQRDEWPLPKSMCLVPHLYTIGLAYGMNPLTGQPSPAGQWRVRNVICWARPNPPVGSLGKRNVEKRTGDYKFRPATSYITVACRGTGRYFDLDAVRTPNDRTAETFGVTERRAGRIVPNGGRETKPIGGVIEQNPAGAPPLDWHTDDLDGDWLWRLATQPYPGSHYATFPLALPRRLILAMCPQRVCQDCGWPSERVVGEPTYVDSKSGKPYVPHVWQSGIANGRAAHTNKAPDQGAHRTAPTLGWTDCGHDAWRTGRTIDPFGGSGTTAVAAALEHRDAVLIDLDERNIDLVRERLNGALIVHHEHRTGNTVTWTVEAASDEQRQHHQAGQLTLLGEDVA